MSFTPYHLDAIAFAWFVALIAIFRLYAEREANAERSIVGAAQKNRSQWMRNMACRENRMLDGVILQALSHGNAFFASTSAISIGGLTALLGSGEKAQQFLERLPYAAKATPELWEMKIVLLIAFFVYAFFKFAWAFRLSHYTAIMIGATPIADATNQVEREAHAERAARLIGIAADHANSGLRSFYYAIAALAWFYHPLLFMLAATWVVVILVRREFFSRSRAILNGEPASP